MINNNNNDINRTSCEKISFLILFFFLNFLPIFLFTISLIQPNLLSKYVYIPDWDEYFNNVVRNYSDFKNEFSPSQILLENNQILRENGNSVNVPNFYFSSNSLCYYSILSSKQSCYNIASLLDKVEYEHEKKKNLQSFKFPNDYDIIHYAMFNLTFNLLKLNCRFHIRLLYRICGGDYLSFIPNSIFEPDKSRSSNILYKDNYLFFTYNNTVDTLYYSI